MIGSNLGEVRLSVAIRLSGGIGGVGGEARRCRGDEEDEDELANMLGTGLSDL